jgi:hypothetical protein
MAVDIVRNRQLFFRALFVFGLLIWSNQALNAAHDSLCRCLSSSWDE